MDWWFFIEVFIGGLLSGVMYSLVALGFVLIFKASGVFNHRIQRRKLSPWNRGRSYSWWTTNLRGNNHSGGQMGR